MSHIEPGDSSEVFDGPRGPLGPVQNEFKKLNLFLGLIFENPEETLAEISQDILSLEEHDRFANSVDRLTQRFVEEVGNADAIQAIAPNLDPNRILKLLDSLFDDILDAVFADIARNRDAELLVALVSGVVGIQAGLKEIRNNSLSEDEKKQVFSSIIAFFFRLEDLIKSEDPDQDDFRALVRDAGVAIFYIDTALEGDSKFPDPADADYSALRRATLNFGAAAVYARMPISLGRGAELADTSRFEFEEVLARYGIKVRSGPSSIDELYNDGIGLVNE